MDCRWGHKWDAGKQSCPDYSISHLASALSSPGKCMDCCIVDKAEHNWPRRNIVCPSFNQLSYSCSRLLTCHLERFMNVHTAILPTPHAPYRGRARHEVALEHLGLLFDRNHQMVCSSSTYAQSVAYSDTLNISSIRCGSYQSLAVKGKQVASSTPYIPVE